jgi:cytochrome c biogenesis protein CcmG/thiol:disulfide interchange protein DsbE
LPLAFFGMGVVLGLDGCSLQQPLAQANQSQATVGRPAPDFTGTDLDGRQVRLSDYRGHPLVLNFWASWCGPCRAEEPGLLNILHQYQPMGLEILGVTVRDNLGQAKIYRDEFKVPYRSIFDQAARLAYAYQIDAPPSSVFIDKDGVVQYKITGALGEESLRQLIADKLHVR